MSGRTDGLERDEGGSLDRSNPGETPASLSLSDAAVATDVELLATLGNETRYRTLRLVAEADEAVCVCELEPALDVSQGAVSQALSRLFSAGLVDREKAGRWRYYAATPRARRVLRVVDETRNARTPE